MSNINKNKKIVVAMSGGIDSSVAVALLKKAGHDVIGFFIRLNGFSSEAEKRARKVAKVLKIPFEVFDFRKEFKKRIIDNFLEEYKKGTTPNPCVVCNKEIKFGLLLERALKLDADYIATGHYARLKKTKDELHLLRGKDKEKDQSYFLWKLNQKQLRHVLFPVGNYTKNQVRKLAKKLKLPTFNAPESQEICFVPNANISEFLKIRIKTNKGRIINTEGKVIGEHYGLWFHTIGQRKGIKLAGGPYYVLDKDLKHNHLIVTKNEEDLLKKESIVKNVNWISGERPKTSLKIKAKIRYRSDPAEAVIKKLQIIPKQNKFATGQASYKLQFKTPQRAITPGQSAVFYKKEELLGGGIIC